MTTIRNGAQSREYHDARTEACLLSIVAGDYDAVEAYDAAGCFMPEGGLSDDVLAAIEFDESPIGRLMLGKPA